MCGCCCENIYVRHERKVIETEEEFKTSLQFAKEIGFEKVHTFPYSERQGTVASRKGDNVPKQEKERRAAVMIEETNKIRHEYFNKLIGAKEVVLFEKLSTYIFCVEAGSL